MAVTIKDVAALAGVSPSTVSRTCKNNPSISTETKEKVRKAMIELGYEVNFQASNLASQYSRTIGIILPASAREVYENAFYLEAIRGISHYCNQRQYMSTVVTGQDEDEILKAIQSMSRSGKVDGFIVLYSRKDDPIIDYLFSEGLLYILIGKATQYTNQTLYIDNDNLLAGEDATEYLYQLGHRKMNVSGDNTEAISSLLLQDEPPTAIVVSDDILAVSLERVCLQNHVSIPDDLSIISFNNSLFARSTSPQLTSIDINSKQLGIEAASQMINHIENPNLVATKIIVPHQLIERDSCCKING